VDGGIWQAITNHIKKSCKPEVSVASGIGGTAVTSGVVNGNTTTSNKYLFGGPPLLPTEAMRLCAEEGE